MPHRDRREGEGHIDDRLLEAVVRLEVLAERLNAVVEQIDSKEVRSDRPEA